MKRQRGERAGKKTRIVLSEPVGAHLEPLKPKNGKNRPNQAVKAAVLERDEYTCQYCGGVAETVDHVVPKAKGGSNSKKNLVAACGFCNNQKADKDIKPRGTRSKPRGT